MTSQTVIDFQEHGEIFLDEKFVWQSEPQIQCIKTHSIVYNSHITAQNKSRFQQVRTNIVRTVINKGLIC